jgi:16S rRNA (cytosine1402-N4)-methyltransferase
MSEHPPTYHLPVLLPEVIRILVTDRKGIYVDGTVGGAGHALGLLANLDKKARYIGIDRDSEAIGYASHRLQTYPAVSLHQANFASFPDVLDELNIAKIDGLLLDLGVSSYQIDKIERGFAYGQDAYLDMRMNQKSSHTAADLLNELSEAALSDIFYNYGEERKSRQIARRIISTRREKPVYRSAHLCRIIDSVVPARYAIKSYARIFQALRIAVNDELQNLEKALENSVKYLKNGGRCVIISYHSLEDRIVKTFFKTQADPCTCPPEWPLCICGKEATFKILTSRPVTASVEEINKNIRARSARLRASERI